MTTLTTLILPRQIFAGDTLQLSGTLTKYSAADYVLHYVLLSSLARITFDASASGSSYLVSVDKATTATWKHEGWYDWTAYVTDTGDTEEHSVYAGKTEIVLRADIAPIADRRSHAEKMLAAVEALLENRATKDQQSYSIHGRSLTRMTPAELVEWRNYYRTEVARERGTGGRTKVKYVL